MTIWEILREFGLPVGTGVVGYFAGKPKRKIELDGGQVENANKVLAMYENIAERLQGQLNKSDEVISSLKDTIVALRDREETCKKTLEELQKEYDRLVSTCDQQHKELTRLRKDIATLKELINENTNTTSDSLHA